MRTGWRLMVMLVCGCVLLASNGCGRAPKQDDQKKPPAGKSSAQLMIEGVTGKAAVDAGEKMKADIEAIAERQNAALDEVLEE